MYWKQSAKKLLLASKITSLLGLTRLPSVVILRYHSIQPDPEPFADSIGRGIIHSASEFDSHMAMVRQRFVPVTLDDILQSAIEQKPLPRRAVAITFDDGFQDNLEVAAPILGRYDLKATFYASVGWISSRSAPWFCRLRHAFFNTSVDYWGGIAENDSLPLANTQHRTDAFLAACYHCASLNGEAQEVFVSETEQQLVVEWPRAAQPIMMDWNGLRELESLGHIVGSHTVTHPNMAHVDEGAAYQEMEQAKQRLEEQLGKPIIHFSYPSPCLQPHWTEQTISIAERVGYKTSVTCNSGGATIGSNMLCLPRIACSTNPDQLRWDIETCFLGMRP